jgi:hypothetical protein
LLSVNRRRGRPTAGRPAAKQITDDLIDALARKVEAGYEVKELTEPIDIAEAKAKLDAVLDQLAAAGFSVWGWGDGSIQVGQLNGSGVEYQPRCAVDDPRSR